MMVKIVRCLDGVTLESHWHGLEDAANIYSCEKTQAWRLANRSLLWGARKDVKGCWCSIGIECVPGDGIIFAPPKGCAPVPQIASGLVSTALAIKIEKVEQNCYTLYRCIPILSGVNVKMDFLQVE
jgi:hypothetical protein